MTDMLMWLDLETTGTDEHKDPILEIALTVTGDDLEPLVSYTSVVNPVINSLAYWRRSASPYVFGMHEHNGLWRDLAAGRGVEAWEAEEQAIGTARQAGAHGQFILAGSGVAHFDRRFLDAQMPKLAKLLRYYCIDVGVLRRALPLVGLADLVRDNPQEKPHRAMLDVQLHLDEMRYYRDALGGELVREALIRQMAATK